MDDVIYLEYPYTDELLVESLYQALDLCHKYEPKWINGLTPMEQFSNVKGYAKAVKNKRLVILSWDIDDGYYITPTKKIPKEGYTHQKEEKYNLGKSIRNEELVVALKQALAKSTTY